MTKKELEKLVQEQSKQISDLIAMLEKEKSRPVIEIKQGEKQHYPAETSPLTYPYSPTTTPSTPLDWPFVRWISASQTSTAR